MLVSNQMGTTSVSLSGQSNQLNTALKKADIKKEFIEINEQHFTALSDQITQMIDPKYKGNFFTTVPDFSTCDCTVVMACVEEFFIAFALFQNIFRE